MMRRAQRAHLVGIEAGRDLDVTHLLDASGLGLLAVNRTVVGCPGFSGMPCLPEKQCTHSHSQSPG